MMKQLAVVLNVGRLSLVLGVLLMTAVARADDQPRTVQFTNGFADGAEFCPSDCPPGGPSAAMPDYGMPSPQWPGAVPQPSAPPTIQSMPGQPSPARPLPQANPSSPLQAPFSPQAPGLQPTQAGGGPLGPGNALAAASAPSSVAPNMIGDFFGGISSEPLILPGAQLIRGGVPVQAILFQPVEMIGGPDLINYYRAVNPLGGGTFETNNFVYIPSANGRFTDANPSRRPPQLLQEFDDGGVFVGDPADLTGDPANMIPGGVLTDPGPFIALDSGQVGDVDVLDPETPTTLLGEQLFNIYDALLVFVPTPGSGGGVGRQKIAENTSPIPRDRVFINHSTFTDVPLTGEGVNVYRFSPGIEKAFYEQRFSIEVRLPFASTIDSDISAGGGTSESSTQFGNIVTTVKALVKQTPISSVAVGVSMTAPTAKDLNVSDLRGAPLLGIENESVHVLPFIGGAHTRGRWFSQWYVQGDIDTTGSPVEIRNVLTDDLEDAGELHDAAFLYASASLGYWIYQSGQRSVSFDSAPGRSIKRTVYTGSGITGFAPLVEFHFNRSLQKSEVITSGPIQLRSASDFALSNLIVGGTMTFGGGASITAAWGTPIIGQDDKQYQSEARLVYNYEY